jgi:hypothetical protein
MQKNDVSEKEMNIKRYHSMDSESSLDDRESLNKEDIINGFVIKDSKQEYSQSKIFKEIDNEK